MRFISDLGSIVPLLVIAFLATALAAFLLTPLVARVARRLDIVDRPNHRRVNVIPVPRGGGLAVVIAFLGAAIALIVANDQLDLVTVPSFVGPGHLVALIGGGALAAALGALDDYFDLRARWQLAGQLVVALGAVSLGIGINFVANPFGDGNIGLAGPIAIGFTVFWITGMINSINFIDGLDGLSSGIALIAAVTLGLISLTTTVGQPFVALLCFALAGALLGFLRWNFHPAMVFAGTSGTMFVGYTLAVLSIMGTAKVAVALLVLGVPIIDTFWIIVRRLVAGRPPFTPDRGHIHHRLLDLGLSQRQTVLLIYGIGIALATLSFLLSGRGQVYAFLGLAVVLGLVLFALTRGEFAADALEAESYVDDEPKEAPPSNPIVRASPAEPVRAREEVDGLTG
jgi:UDP-GlcNAc:undecaprenyl-phosphate GlcNAc-1-phosphate transferase